MGRADGKDAVGRGNGWCAPPGAACHRPVSLQVLGGYVEACSVRDPGVAYGGLVRARVAVRAVGYFTTVARRCLIVLPLVANV